MELWVGWARDQHCPAVHAEAPWHVHVGMRLLQAPATAPTGDIAANNAMQETNQAALQTSWTCMHVCTGRKHKPPLPPTFLWYSGLL